MILDLYRWLLARPSLYWLNLHLYKLSLRGLGVLNAAGSHMTGETWWLQKLGTQIGAQPCVILDIGANTGTYSEELFQFIPQATVIACEPHPLTFAKLKRTVAHVLQKKQVILEQVAVSDKAGRMRLWDFAEKAPLKHSQPTSTLASLNRSVIEELHHQPAQAYSVKVSTVDILAKKHRIDRIHLLKIDTEGYELQVLQGARRMITEGRVNMVQLEFNEMQVYTRTFVRDLMHELPGYTWYRLLPHGMVKLGPYRPLTHEIFGFQNLVAVRSTTKV